MLKINRTANPGAITVAASRGAERDNTGLVECAIFALAGLTVALLMIAHEALSPTVQTLLQ